MSREATLFATLTGARTRPGVYWLDDPDRVPQGVVAHFGLDRDDAELGEVSAGDELVAEINRHI